MNKSYKIKFVYIPVVFIGFFILISTLKNKYMGKMNSMEPGKMSRQEKDYTLKLRILFRLIKRMKQIVLQTVNILLQRIL
ncbi:hypothetical protein HMPREF0765_1121 [Sphingobacterium spiritivorum ATCC 33300]|uniref:Uncharacterized protein n=1 Tax=Sphingobacterium spiritivorum ATCC 33300 TaxID=525372 RepID=C2FUW5_SPHSI|nr:hypothetical protein HMPREF0765_1121 [Sphingobacterium spiritivorum ATCC 33300]